MGFLDPIVGGQSLRIPSIHSPNYAAGSAGWTINVDGSAEFNNLTIRGTFFGTNYIINSSGAFFYFGTPATGNLALSIAAVAGVDSFSNSYPAGFGVFNNSGTLVDNIGGTSGNATFGDASAAHFVFDNVNHRLNMFDQNNALTARLSASSTNSNLTWLYNAASKFVALDDQGILIGPLTTPGAIPTAGDQARAFSIINFTGSQAGTAIRSFHNAADPGGDGCEIAMLSGNSSLLIGDPSGPCAVVTDQLGASAANLYLSGDVVACDNVGSPLTKTVVTPGTGWSVTAGSLRGAPQCQYWRVGDILHIRGAMATTSATPASTAFTLGAGYTPTSAWNLQQDYIFQQSSAGAQKGPAHLFLSGSSVSINNLTTPAIGDIVNFNHTFTLGNTP